MKGNAHARVDKIELYSAGRARARFVGQKHPGPKAMAWASRSSLQKIPRSRQ